MKVKDTEGLKTSRKSISIRSVAVRYRSAKTGRFISKSHAVRHPSTTVKETIKTTGTGPKRKQ